MQLPWIYIHNLVMLIIAYRLHSVKRLLTSTEHGAKPPDCGPAEALGELWDCDLASTLSEEPDCGPARALLREAAKHQT